MKSPFWREFFSIMRMIATLILTFAFVIFSIIVLIKAV